MRVAVLGAGYAGLTLARRLERTLPELVDLVVVDEHDYHLVQHELHRVVRHPDLGEVLRVPLDEALDRAGHRRARVAAVDHDAGTVELDDGAGLDADYLAVCLGARTAFYGLPGVEEHAITLKRLADAEAIRERALALGDGERVVVGGAGLSGVQVAGELAALAREEDRDYEVLLLEQESHVAPTFPASFRVAVREELEDRDVTVRVGTAVEGADADAVHLADGERIGYGAFVWTGGIEGGAALGGDRPVVRATLRGGDRAFLVGDAARVLDERGDTVPASAQTAVRQARVAATNVERLVENDFGGDGGFEPRLARYRYDSPGWVVSVGDGAVAQLGPTVLRGGPARLAKATIGASYLTGVGAAAEAVDLVREELGWPTGADAPDDPRDLV